MRKPPQSSPTSRSASSAQYIQELGGGPEVPEGDDLREGGNLATGGELFRINCSQCHAFGGGGGALSSGKYAPSLRPATDRQIYAAMLSGPQNMPVFGDNQLTPEQKADIIAYIQETLKHDQDPGGFNLGPVRPVHRGHGDLPGRHRRAGLREPVDCGQVVTGRINRFQCCGADLRRHP